MKPSPTLLPANLPTVELRYLSWSSVNVMHIDSTSNVILQYYDEA